MKMEEAILSCFDKFSERIIPEDLVGKLNAVNSGSNFNSAFTSLCVSSSSDML